jgi:adenylate cyclase
MSFFNELKRRNVFKVVIAYVVTSWLVAQVAELAADSFGAPDWVMKMFITLLALGFPFAIIFAWVFEMTPDGIKKEKDIDRSQSMTAATGQKLNYTIIGLLVLALGYFAFDKYVASPGDSPLAQVSTPTTNVSKKDNSIAVLPFVNVSDDSSNEYFSDGLSEELLNLLAKIPELKVAARTSSFHFKGKTGDVAEIGKQLKVAHVLEGSVRKAGNQVRITAQLIKTDDGYHLWSETYDRELDNIFQIQDEIATAVVEALKITLLGAAPKTAETDLQAYQLFLEAQFFLRQGKMETIAKSIDLFKQAIEIDDNYAPTWAGLAGSYILYTVWGGMPIDKGHAFADEAIEKALSIDPDNAQAYVVRGRSRMYNKFRFNEGMEDALRALKLDPGNAGAARLASIGYRILGQFSSAVEYSLLAIELDPVRPSAHIALCRAYYYSRMFDEAESACRKALTLSPGFTSAHYRVGRILLAKGKPHEALREMQQEVDGIYLSTGLAMAQYTLGNQQASNEALNSIITEAADNAAYQIAEVYAFRGEIDHAFEWLDHSFDIRDSGLVVSAGDPAFQSLHKDPRWEQLMEKLGLTQAWRGLPPELGGPAQ